MKKFIVLFVAGLLFAGCYTKTNKHTLFNADKTEAYTLEEVKSVNLFAPTYQYQRAKVCNVKTTHVDSKWSSGYDKHEAIDCKVMTKAQGWNKDLGTPTGPSLMQAGTGLGGAALIQDGLEDSGDSINNVNQQGQIQGQAQGQIQGQIGINSGGCRGNCGGGPR